VWILRGCFTVDDGHEALVGRNVDFFAVQSHRVAAEGLGRHDARPEHNIGGGYEFLRHRILGVVQGFFLLGFLRLSRFLQGG
jgi:hypothetical protein